MLMMLNIYRIIMFVVSYISPDENLARMPMIIFCNIFQCFPMFLILNLIPLLLRCNVFVKSFFGLKTVPNEIWFFD